MIHFKNVRTLEGTVQTKDVPSDIETTIECNSKLLLLPALIDPSPQLKLSEMELLKGGITTVFQPLLSHTIRVKPYLKPDVNDLMSIAMKKKEIAGVVIPIGEPHFSLDDEETLNQLFRLIAQENLIGVITLPTDARKTISVTADLVEKYDAQIFFPNISSFDQLDQINEAKKRDLWLFTGISGNSLLASSKFLGVLKQGDFDVVCTQGLLPQFLKAHNEGSINLTDLMNYTRTNVERLFVLNRTEDVVIVDLENTETAYVVANEKLINTRELP